MNRFGLRFHHLGLAVHKPETARDFLEGLGYLIGPVVYDSNQNVNLMMCSSQDMPDVEVIYPGEGETPIDNILQRQDGLVYHVCYITEDIDRAIAAMTEAGHRLLCISPPTAAPLFGGRRVSFYQLVGVGTIEIIDASDEPAK